MSLRGKKVFVSGGNGVIGKELVQKLYSEGAIIFVGDLKSRPLTWPPEIQYRQGDLNYISKEEIEEFKPQYFFHLAATFERSVETYEFWEENHWHNVRLSTYLMTLMKDIPSLEKVIFASSYLIYNPELYSFSEAQTGAVRLKESDPVYPRNLTGVAKLNHEIELSFLNEFNNSRYKTVAARIFRSYGKNSRDIISRWIRALLKNETLTVYRKEGLFDYIFAGEVAEGLLRLAQNPYTAGIYNLGNDNARKVSEVLDVLRSHFPGMKIVEASSDIPYEASQADMGKTYEALSWKPSIQIEDAIPMMIRHEKEAGFIEENEQIRFNVLVTSISKKIPMLKAVKKACRKLSPSVNLTGSDMNPQCIGRWFVDSFWQMPPAGDESKNEITRYCIDNNIKIIIPSRDGELLFWSGISGELKEKGISVMISDPEIVKRSIDKLLFWQFLNAEGLQGIQTETDIGRLKFSTYVVKERFGAGSDKLGLGLSAHEAVSHASKLKEPVFQPFIKGKEFSIDIYNTSDCKFRAAVVRSRDLVVSGESQITKGVIDENLQKLAVKFSEKMKFSGHGILQVIVDENKTPHIIEFNCRFGGASTFAVSCGLDSFYWFILESLGNDISGMPVFLNLKNKVQIRYPEDLIAYDTGV